MKRWIVHYRIANRCVTKRRIVKRHIGETSYGETTYRETSYSASSYSETSYSETFSTKRRKAKRFRMAKQRFEHCFEQRIDEHDKTADSSSLVNGKSNQNCIIKGTHLHYKTAV